MQCEVVELKDKGVIVKSGHISGIIPKMHLADIPLKMPEKRFIPGKKVKCRVSIIILCPYKISLKINKVSKTSLKKKKDKLPSLIPHSTFVFF